MAGAPWSAALRVRSQGPRRRSKSALTLAGYAGADPAQTNRTNSPIPIAGIARTMTAHTMRSTESAFGAEVSEAWARLILMRRRYGQEGSG
jgi:hypothetical protein